MPGTAARTLACAAELLARFLKLRYEGIAIASRIPRMMMTTSSSIRVKPPSSRAMRFRRVLIIRSRSFRGESSGPSGIGGPHRTPLDQNGGLAGRRRGARFHAPLGELVDPGRA